MKKLTKYISEALIKKHARNNVKSFYEDLRHGDFYKGLVRNYEYFSPVLKLTNEVIEAILQDGEYYDDHHINKDKDKYFDQYDKFYMLSSYDIDKNEIGIISIFLCHKNIKSAKSDEQFTRILDYNNDDIKNIKTNSYKNSFINVCLINWLKRNFIECKRKDITKKNNWGDFLKKNFNI